MVFIVRVIVLMSALVAGVDAKTLAVPMDEPVESAYLHTATAHKKINTTQSKTFAISGLSNARPLLIARDSTLNNSVIQPVLLLRISFTDQDFRYSHREFEDLMFSTAAGVNSVARYYLENSYGQFHIKPAQENQGVVNDGIVDVRLPYAHPNFGDHYGAKSQALVRDAMVQANAAIDLQSFDQNGDGELASNELAIILMVAGYENAYGGSSAPEPRVWAHKSEMIGVHLDGVRLTGFAMFGEQHQNHLATIGIISHEMGHLLFALPDLYDRQGKSNGIGRWGLMGLGSWNSSGGYSGNSPAQMMAWSKVKAGFLQPEDVMGDELEFDLASATHSPEVMRVWLDPFRHGEHFLLEYRQQSLFDNALPGEGLLISHIDDRVGYGNAGSQNDVAEHKLVDIEEADGRNDLDQQENRGDRLDVFNDAYGQDYFGSSSFPDSLDYQGNMSGVEIFNIRVADRVRGTISLPYDQLGDNLGHDDEVGPAWGAIGQSVQSMVALSPAKAFSWAHGIDLYSPGDAVVDVALYAGFLEGRVEQLLHLTQQHSVTKGWNRITFSERVNLDHYERIYLQVTAMSNTSRPLNIDAEGESSGQSFVNKNGRYQPVNFDFNQRLLVANQSQAFQYKAPKTPVVISSSQAAEKTSAGSWLPVSTQSILPFVFSVLGLMFAIKGRRYP